MEKKENIEAVETDLDKVMIQSEDGTEKEAEVLLVFSFDEGEVEESDAETEYIIYTFDETDDAGYVILYASILRRETDDTVTLLDIEDKEIWSKVKEVMRELIKAGKEEA